MRDRVLFLKHNLNARAIGSLNKELVTVSANVDSLVAELERSIKEADDFIKEMNVRGCWCDDEVSEPERLRSPRASRFAARQNSEQRTADR